LKKGFGERGIRSEPLAERSEEEAAGCRRKRGEPGSTSNQDDCEENRIPFWL
jgi:hypothetical protein